ncbi:hypothetical protein BpHYR1_005693 [Brachionus plicatilis]|uniref:Uncharacterized protein n=1 Tax=Brachionus plicatilis TaxID=10195 RepID=A0A3M7PXM5_BRAPC|nr:hypothetical protein BpHYR1_005693 [Brachionus plicatilis]
MFINRILQFIYLTFLNDSILTRISASCCAIRFLQMREKIIFVQNYYKLSIVLHLLNNQLFLMQMIEIASKLNLNQRF